MKSCDLEFFHLEEPDGSNSLTESDTAELLSSLRRQKNLKALALIIPHCALLLGSASTMLGGGEQGDLWPRLKMLSLGVTDRHWLEQFAKFEKLQILCLQKFTPIIPTFSQYPCQKIAKCRHLRVIDIASLEPIDVEALLDIAHGCPLLQKFSVRSPDLGGELELAEKLCIDLLHALPRLEHFELDLRFRMDGASIQDLARHCPQLTGLALPRARLCLSLTLLTEAHPFQQLEIMHFAEIFFEDPRRSMQWDKIQGIAAEWRRIFPKLRGMPCPADVYSSYMEEDDLNEESEGDSVSADEQMSLSEPGLDFDDYESDWFILRTKLWKVLGCPVVHDNIHDKIQNMWQKNLEIETTGWPVVPLMAFSDPDLHSTTTKSYR